MILAKLNQPEFEYDIHSLIKAFFPEENVSATAEDKKYEEEITLQFQVEYEPQQIKIEWKEKNQESHDRSFPVDFLDRTETKNELKQNFYQILSEITGKKLPWGTLTGIRPTKIPMKFLEEGKTEAEIRAYMQKTYFAPDEKIDLSIDIADTCIEGSVILCPVFLSLPGKRFVMVNAAPAVLRAKSNGHGETVISAVHGTVI